MTLLLNFLKVFNLSLSPSNSATSAFLGFSLGMLPLISPIAWMIIVVAFVIRLNSVYLALFWVFGELIAVLLNQPISLFGESILTASFLQELWQSWYNQSIWRILSFNHTYIMGGSVVLILALVPFWAGCYFLFRQYQQAFFTTKLSKFVSLPGIRLLFNVDAHGEVGKKESFIGQWINIKGSIFLLALVVVITIGFYFVQTATIKNWMNKEVSKQWGAPVEIGSVSLGISPIGFAVKDLRLAGKKNPDKEALFIGNFTAYISLYHLLSGKWIFDQIQLAQIIINPNEFSSDNEKNSDGNDEKTSLSLDQYREKFALPSAEEMLGGDQLMTYKRKEELQVAIQQAKKDNNSWQSSVPSDEEYEQYKKRLENLKKRKVNAQSAPGLLAEVELLQTDVNTDLEKFDQVTRKLQVRADRIREIMQQLPQAPDEDWQRINQKYQLTSGGNGNLMSLLLGDTVSQWLRYGQLAYQYAEPYIGEFKSSSATEKIDYFEFGRYIFFDEEHPQPDFNIRDFIAQSNDESWQLQLKNVNFDQVTSQLPTTGQLTIDAQQTNPKFIDVVMDYRSTKNSMSKLKYDSGAETVKDKVILDNSNLSMIIGHAQEQQKLNFVLDREGEIQGFWQQNFTKIIWDDEKMNQARGNKMRPGLMNKISDFSNRIDISGKIGSPKVGISSNLDSRLRQVLDEAMQQTLDNVKREVRSRLEQEATASLGEGKESLVGLTQNQQKVASIQRKWEKNINSEIQSYQDELMKQSGLNSLDSVKENLLNQLK